MTELFFKYYYDITKYNLLFCIVVMLLTHRLAATIISFGSIGMLVALFIYRYYQNVEYYFYLNAGLTKKGIIVRSFLINALIATLLLLFLWSIA